MMQRNWKRGAAVGAFLLAGAAAVLSGPLAPVIPAAVMWALCLVLLMVGGVVAVLAARSSARVDDQPEA